MNIVNSAVGQKGIIMKVKIAYSMNGQKLNFEEKIDKFPANMWFLLIVLTLFFIHNLILFIFKSSKKTLFLQCKFEISLKCL